MSGQAETPAGISVDVDDLVRVRAQIANLNLQNIRRRTSYRSGAQEARLRGRGMEYEESRSYVVGDDVRTMDWRVMARTGEAHTKIFAEEKERRYLFAVDLSASMFFGTRYSFKSWTAAHACAHLGWLAHQAGDRLGGIVVGPETHHVVRPGKSRSGLLGIFHHLAEISNIQQPEAMSSRLNFMLAEIQRVSKPGSILSVISDFVGLDTESAEILSLLVKHNDVNLFWVHDDIEVNPWPAGNYPLRTAKRKFDLDLTGNAAQNWLAEQQRHHRAKLESLAFQLAVPLFPVSCNHAVTGQMSNYLEG